MENNMNITSAQYSTGMGGNTSSIQATIDGVEMSVPLDLANRHYTGIIEATAINGSFWGDTVPEPMATEAAKWLFNQQATDYKTATARLAQYQLSVGVPESSETIVIGQEWNEEAMEMQDVTETIVTPAIPALDATVEETTYDMETDTSTTTTVANPLIVKDDEERAAAQTVIDNTPQPVIDGI
jgi:hypothetical protein